MINYIHFPIWISFSVPISSPKGTYLHSNFYLFLFSSHFASGCQATLFANALSSLTPKKPCGSKCPHFEFEKYDEIIFGCASFILDILNVDVLNVCHT